MILESNHSKEAIQEITKTQFNGKDPQLVEKILMALTLLELLAQEKIEFVFKGGTCLLLLLKTPRRFSIDLDLIITKRDDLLATLKKICEGSKLFTRYEEDVRAGSKIPKAHYKVFYQSFVSGKESYVLIDIIEDRYPYPSIQESEIKPNYFKLNDSILKVKTPTIDGILGDKLTAFAPRTTGILLGKNKEMEIAKQLFDIASLFDHATSLEEIRKTFNLVAKKEIAYRELKINEVEVLNDTFEASMVIALQGSHRPEVHIELQKGTSSLKNYIFESFGPAQIHVSASKVAYLCQLLLKDQKAISYFKNEDLSKETITNPNYNKLNKIKKVSPEAFYYWKHTIDLFGNE